MFTLTLAAEAPATSAHSAAKVADSARKIICSSLGVRVARKCPCGCSCGLPPHQPALREQKRLIDQESEDAERHQPGVNVGAAKRALRQKDLVADARQRGLHLGDH